jgi:phosphoribosylaminoimidazole-succinocarboxamide synthase
MGNKAVYETNLHELKLLCRGKVRDIYDLGERLLIVATDRLSAFDYVFRQPIPDKGRVLNLLSAFWFGRTNRIVENHLISTSLEDLPETLRGHSDLLNGRFSLVKKAEKIVPMECVVRGYLAGSGFKEFKQTGKVCGIALKSGLREGDKLNEPIFTPSTKATKGHDLPLTPDEARSLVGKDIFEKLRDISIELYEFGAEYCLERGVILADTKFEFGICDGRLLLCDELFTPDSSRFWPRDSYAPPGPQVSLDKQFVRDYLEGIGWDKKPPVPDLPADVVANTSKKYKEIYRIITGTPLPEFHER